ncbi:MAG: amidase [Bifidobacterium crudilactis]|jgi:Asp-tRNA(Asn)/Glu-tRNA(Gln) amidotransferase A subunit family amidase
MSGYAGIDDADASSPFPESAQALLAGYRSKAFSPSEVIGTLAERINRLNPGINAITETLFDEAGELAAAADRCYASGDADPFRQPLLGVPVILKEKHQLAGHTVSQGVKELEVLATRHHPIVERILRSGGIPLVRSSTPEFCCATVTQSALWGTCRNPWNLDKTSGGSSGGSAAALAAGFAPLATGSDIGGSARIPAAYCGVVGYKAPYGVVPGLHPSTMDWYRSGSAMARTVEDVRLLHNVISGQHRRDQLSVPMGPVAPVDGSDRLRGCKVLVSEHLGDYPTQRATARNLMDVAQSLRDRGVVVERCDLPWHADEVMRLAFAHYGHILARFMRHDIIRAHANVSPYIHEWLEYAQDMADAMPLDVTLAKESAMRDELSEVMDGATALLCPVSAVDSMDAEVPPVSIGKSGGFYWQDQMAVPFNINNRCPSLAIPSGFGPEGVPTGLQIVGNPYDQAAVFDVAYAIEELRPWASKHPPVAV